MVSRSAGPPLCPGSADTRERQFGVAPVPPVSPCAPPLATAEGLCASEVRTSMCGEASQWRSRLSFTFVPRPTGHNSSSGCLRKGFPVTLIKHLLPSL